MVNGKNVSVPNHITCILDLLQYYEIDKSFVIIELNEQIIQKMAYEQAMIFEGDRMEIIHFVGGG